MTNSIVSSVSIKKFSLVLLKANFLCLILFENQIQTTSASPYRTQVQPATSFLVCSLIFIEFKSYDMINITTLLQYKILIEFSDNLGYNTFNLNKKE